MFVVGVEIIIINHRFSMAHLKIYFEIHNNKNKKKDIRSNAFVPSGG